MTTVGLVQVRRFEKSLFSRASDLLTFSEASGHIYLIWSRLRHSTVIVTKWSGRLSAPGDIVRPITAEKCSRRGSP